MAFSIAGHADSTAINPFTRHREGIKTLGVRLGYFLSDGKWVKSRMLLSWALLNRVYPLYFEFCGGQVFAVALVNDIQHKIFVSIL